MNGMTLAFLRALGSLKFAVVLLLLLASVLAWATFIESAHGREYTQWYVYRNTWFFGLLGLLGANIFAATVVRYPWKKTRRGFFVTHAGLLILLAGSVQTFIWGIEGVLSLQEGQSGSTMLITDRSQLTISHQGRDSNLPLEFLFHAGPVDWPEGKTLDLGELEGIHVRVLRFLRHAEVTEEWVDDEKGWPGVKFALAGPGGQTVLEEWLVAEQFGGQFSIGPASFRLHRANYATMLTDFLEPPGPDMDEHGVLSMHHEGEVYRIPVSENVGKKVAVGPSEIEVEIVQYLPNARPDQHARFTSEDDRPENPVLELRIHDPQKEEPSRQITFAKYPMLSMDGIHGTRGPVQFWYHHPAVKPEPGVEFLQTPDGKLYARVIEKGEYRPQGEVAPGDSLDAGGHFKVVVLEHRPRVSKQVSIVPAADGKAGGAEAAALVEVQTAGATEQMWLKRNSSNHSFRHVDSPHGRLGIEFGYERYPLGFTVRLIEFRRSKNPGRMGDAAFSSLVRLVDRPMRIDRQHLISMNRPLVHRKFAFYQSSFQDLPEGHQASTFTVGYNPGRFLSYLGSLMICLGSTIMFLSRSNFYKKIWGKRSASDRRRRPESHATTPPRPLLRQEENLSEDDLTVSTAEVQ